MNISKLFGGMLEHFALTCQIPVFAQQSLDLSGDWTSSLGPVRLPGSLLTNNLGDELSVETQWTGSLYDSSFYHNPYMAPYRRKGQMKFPFFLTPNKHYVGEVVYTRHVTVPKSWRGQRVELFLERPHIETTVVVNGQTIGHQMSLNTPHVYDVTGAIRPGDNEIEVTVYNGIENVCVGQDSHSVTDQTQGNWNGLAGRMELRARGRQPISLVRVYPDVQREQVKVVVRTAAKKLSFALDGNGVEAEKENDSTYIIKVNDAKLWSEHSPYVYQLSVTSKDDRYDTSFGMREISIKGRQFYLNGQPIWLRGTVENCNFPLTGYPPTSVDEWLAIFKKCKQYGLNHMRFHSYCPPEAAFIAADQMGFYLQPEGPSWPNHGVKLRRGMAIDQYLMDETKRMVDAYGNHPSFTMMAAGNEPAGDWVPWCNDWVDYWRQTDTRRVYAGASVGGGWAWDSASQYHVKGGARGLDWDKRAPQSQDDFYQSICLPRNFKPTDEQPENQQPYVSHEQGQWCAFPDLNERSQYTGVYKAYNFDVFADLLRDNGMEQQAGKFLWASGKLQTLAYKYDIERNLRTRDYAGFQLLGLNDYSGQGTALVGPLNVFWREKGYVDDTTWRQFCNDVVPLARLPKMVYTNDEQLKVPVEVYNASGRALTQATVRCEIYDDTRSLVSRYELLAGGEIALGKNNEVGTVSHALDGIDKPTKLTLQVVVCDGATNAGEQGDGVDNEWKNTWELWVYPKQVDIDEPAAVALPSTQKKGKSQPAYTADTFLITDTLSEQALDVLRAGGKVLIEAAGKVRYGNDVKQTYLPVFWNTSWFKMRPPHTTGATIARNHPLFREFPTDDWANLNWWELLNRAQVMNLSQFPKDYQSPIQPIDTWHISRKLGMVIEARVEGGRLLMTTMDISRDLDRRVVARQMRKALLDYMRSDDFQPTMTLQPETITNLFENEAPAVNMFTNDSPDELKPKIK